MRRREKTTLAVILVLLFTAVCGFSGRPSWPPPPHSAEHRQANLLFLRFQDALAGQRWPEALSLCSDRVRAKAAEWPSPGAFFKDTLPSDILLSQDFGYWTTSSNFFGLFVPLSEPGSTPVLQWFWGILFTNTNWVVDYPPTKLNDFVAARKAAIETREKKLDGIRSGVETKLKTLKTHLSRVSQKFVIGSPMVFRLELLNCGQSAIHYQDSGVGYHPLTVLTETGELVPGRQEPAQLMVRAGELQPGASVVLAGEIDISRDHALSQPGKYLVQFNGVNLNIGEPVAPEEPGQFGEERNLWPMDFVAVSTRLPSEIIEIEVLDAPKR